MTTLSVDERGRLYIPRRLREEFGEKFRIVRFHDGIKLFPVPEDSVEDLSEALAPLHGASREEIDRAIREEAFESDLEDSR